MLDHDPEYVDERFFRPVNASMAHGPTIKTGTVTYLSGKTSLFSSQPIYCTEFHWVNHTGQSVTTTREEILDAYKTLKSLEWRYKAAYEDVLWFVVRKDSEAFVGAFTWSQEWSSRIRTIKKHLVDACAQIAALERSGRVPSLIIPHKGSIPSDPAKDRTEAPAAGVLSTYPFILTQAAMDMQAQADAGGAPFTLGKTLGKISKELEEKPATKASATTKMTTTVRDGSQGESLPEYSRIPTTSDGAKKKTSFSFQFALRMEDVSEKNRLRFEGMIRDELAKRPQSYDGPSPPRYEAL